jgi:CRP-like cAMP-binding protein
LHGIEERLARWLLTCRDRVDGDDLPLTHEFLGQMLGAPRTTVTLTAGLLHRAGMIEYSRGMVKITDRSALENSACECYRTVRDEFRRLHLL